MLPCSVDCGPFKRYCWLCNHGLFIGENITYSVFAGFSCSSFWRSHKESDERYWLTFFDRSITFFDVKKALVSPGAWFSIVLEWRDSALQMHVFWGGDAGPRGWDEFSQEKRCIQKHKGRNKTTKGSASAFLGWTCPNRQSGAPTPGHMHLQGATVSFQNDGLSF